MRRLDSPSADSVRKGVADLEGYLLWQAETEKARAAAEAFTAGLDWLTAGQREEVLALYTRTELDRSRASVTHIARRARELREEYQARYDRLRRRAVAWCLALGAVAVFLLCLARTR